MTDIYVIVADNDNKSVNDNGGPIVFEQYTRTASLDNIKERIKVLSITYGNCRIAKLVFIDQE